MYRVQSRSYLIGGRSYTWQSSGFYYIEDATQLMQRVRDQHSDVYVGIDAWLVPA